LLKRPLAMTCYAAAKPFSHLARQERHRLTQEYLVTRLSSLLKISSPFLLTKHNPNQFDADAMTVCREKRVNL
jgi:hypothetical protein